MDYVTRSQAGDEAAFAALFEQHKNLVYRTAYLLLGDAHEAEDALQEVFWQVYRSLHSYDPAKGAFTTWLHAITAHRCLNRQRGRRPEIGPVPDGDLAPGQPSPERMIEMDDSLRHLLAGLSDKLRAVVILRYAWDLSYQEIALALDLPLGTVQSRLNAAIRAVRERVLEAGEVSNGL